MSKINDAYNALSRAVEEEVQRLEATGEETDAELAEFISGHMDDFAGNFGDYADLTTRGLDSDAIVEKLQGWGLM